MNKNKGEQIFLFCRQQVRMVIVKSILIINILLKIRVYFLIRLEKLRGIDFREVDNSLFIKTNKESNWYVKSNSNFLDKIFDFLEIDEKDSFVDIGCGKGYVLYYASKKKFYKISGIELDENLVGIAQSNFKNLKIKNIEVYNEDASNFCKYSDFNYFFLFNPFKETTFIKVFDSIVASLKENPREITIIYLNPVCSDYILNSQCVSFYLYKEVMHNYIDYPAHIYKCKVS